MFEIVRSGGIMMLPILLCSVVAIAIIVERFWTLSASRIAPRNALADVWAKIKHNQLDAAQLRELRMSSPLGQILAAGLVNAKSGRQVMIESIELAASHVVHDMERYLATLGTIASISPLLGLLGTVFGMIQIFQDTVNVGSGDVRALAGGIAVALISTAGGLVVAIPSLFFYRMFVRRVESLVVELERESIKLVDALHSSRGVEVRGPEMKFSRNVKIEVGIDLTSLIDVVFILLLFFILTTTFTRESTIRITLPEASSQEITQSPLLIEIMVGSNGNYSVNGRTLEQNDLAGLMAAITDLSAGDTTLPITVVADAEAKHQAVVTAMEAVQTLGFTKFGIATRQPEDR